MNEIKNRYLCVAGVILRRDLIPVLQEKIRELQDLVGDDLDNTKLHGHDIKSGKGIFGVLRTNPDVKARWEGIVFSLIESIDFKMCGIVMDKLNHIKIHGDSAPDPYHHCARLMLEEYLRFLDFVGVDGDVMLESRGKREDHMLTCVFSEFPHVGFLIKTKDHGVAGLILADLLVLGVKFDILTGCGRVDVAKGSFVDKISVPMRGRYLLKRLV